MADQYDAYGNLTGRSITYDNGRTDYFDLAGNLTGFSIDKGAGYADQYDANGYILGTSYRDGSGNITYFDNLGRQIRQIKAAQNNPQTQKKMTTGAALKSLLQPDPCFESIGRKTGEDKNAWIVRIVIAVILPAVTFLLTRAQLPYALLVSLFSMFAFYLSRSFFKQRVLTGMIAVNTIYTLLLSKIYAQFLWLFPTEGVEPLQFIVVGIFFLTGMIFIISIEGKGYYSYGLTRAAEVLFHLAYTIGWLIAYLMGCTTLQIRAVMDVTFLIQTVYAVVILMGRGVQMLNIVRSKSGVSESTGGQIFRYGLYVILFLLARRWDPDGIKIILALLISTAIAFTISRLNLLNRFRIVTVLINSLYSVALIGCFTLYLFYQYTCLGVGSWLMLVLVLFCALYFALNLEQKGYQSFRFTKVATVLFLLAQAVLYVTFRLNIAQDFTWDEIRSIMQYILIGAAVFYVGVILFYFLTKGKKKDEKKTA